MSEQPFKLIWEAEWNDIVCADYPLTPKIWIDESIRPLVGTKVDTLLYNLCSSDAYCCGLESGEILCDEFDIVSDAWVWRYRENTKKLIDADANPPKLACEYGHRLGLKVIPIVRMNDPHDQFYKYEASKFKMANPHLLLGYTGPDWQPPWGTGFRKHPNPESLDAINWGMFDFAHKEVRDHKMAIIEEFITRFDNDGMALDFERDPRYFKLFGNEDNLKLITDIVRQTRQLLDRVSKQRGRPMYLHVRVLPDLNTCWQRGLDVRAWVNEGLVDAVCPGVGDMTFTLDLQPWLELVDGHDCWIYPCSNHWKRTEVTRAWAKLMYQRGAHGLQLFNYGNMLFGHDKNTPPPTQERRSTVWLDDLHPDYFRVLHEIHDPKVLRYLDCDYKFDSHPRESNIGARGGQNQRIYRAIDAIVLPIDLSIGSHIIPFGFAEDLESARQQILSPKVTMRLNLHNYTQPDEFDVSVNNQLLPTETRTAQAQYIMDNFTWITYPLLPEVLNNGENELKVDVKHLNPGIEGAPRLDHVEIQVRYNNLV